MKSRFKLSSHTYAIGVVVLVLLVDQCLKIWIKTHLSIGESLSVFGDWFYLHFIENPGMAFGMKFWGIWGKLILSVIRLAAIVAIAWYLNRCIRRQANIGLVVGISLVLAGAIGNMIDSAFYGYLFDSGTTYDAANGYWVSYAGVSSLNGAGYAGFLQGCVVDMLYFPLIDTNLPAWFPIWGGRHIEFFRPVFNVADSAITCGVIYLILFQRNSLIATEKKKS